MTDSRRMDPGCPICGRPTAEEFQPFCSRRCADVDLGRWLTGLYRIPIVPEDGGEDPTGESA